MKLPLLRRRLRQRDRLVFSFHDGVFAYVQARSEGEGMMRVQRFGLIRLDPAQPAEFAKRLAALGWRGHEAVAMLRTPQYQLLQIEAPAVPPEELRTAARWQIRDMVTQHLDDLTLDVLRVGEDGERASSSLFVVVAPNDEIREVMRVAQQANCGVRVIDVRDMAQRNLQSLVAQRLGGQQRAQAALAIANGHQALLTICANGELYYSRRIEVGEGFLEMLLSGRGGASSEAGELVLEGEAGESDRFQRLVVEVQRSLDLWERTWPSLPLDRVFVHAGEHTGELASWLGQELGQAVLPLDVSAAFPGFEGAGDEERQMCWPLLGVLMRTEERKL